MSQPYRPPHKRSTQGSQQSTSPEKRGMAQATRAPSNSVSFGPVGTPRFPVNAALVARRDSVPVPAPTQVGKGGAVNSFDRRTSAPQVPAPLKFGNGGFGNAGFSKGSGSGSTGGVMLASGQSVDGGVMLGGDQTGNGSGQTSTQSSLQSSASRAAPVAVINIRIERSNRFSTPRTPTFIPSIYFANGDTNLWYKIILPTLAESVFVIESNVDLAWFKEFMCAQDIFPEVHLAITKLAFPNFHWFSGVRENRYVNPYTGAATSSQNLGELSFTLHTAGLTMSAWGEKQRMAIEKTDIFKSKELKIMDFKDIIKQYDLERLFMCDSLHTVNITCIDSDMVAYHCKGVNPISVVHKIREWMITGFRRHGKVVNVNLAVVGGSMMAAPAQPQ